MEINMQMERQKDRHREKPRQAARLWVTHCTHALTVSPACFLRYFEWVSGHIRQPNINGWVGSNGISETLGHQLSHVNLQWRATEGSWQRNREGIRVRQVRGPGRNWRRSSFASSDIKLQQGADFYISSWNFMEWIYWSQRASASMWVPILSKPRAPISRTWLLWKQTERTSWYII